MTRKEEAINRIVKHIDTVKDVPKNESILAVGMDMVEWADKTMLDKVCEWLMNNAYLGESFIDASGNKQYRLLKDLRKAMEE